jgi:hypothetical protein
MNANTGIWIGLGVMGAILIASIGGDEKIQRQTEITKRPNVEPKKIIL